MNTTVRLAHISDTHAERHQYPVNSPTTGRNQREQDMLRAMVGVLEDVALYDPPLVIHSGDVADKPLVSYRTQLQIQHAFHTLTQRPDGTSRFVVVISGNHDMPRDPREPCYLEPALRPLSSVAVVTNRYEQVSLADYVARGEAPAELENIVVHALPHDQLKRSDWDDIKPIPGKINILTSHGVVGGSDLYKQSLGREYAIPIDVLTRGWDYVALGHWHKRGPIAVGGYTEADTPIWYAGSPEHCGFSDLQPSQSGRGYLRVEVSAGSVPVVHPVDLPIRQMFKMPTLDATGMTYEAITATLVEHVQGASLEGAVVDQVIVGVHRDTWSLVDVAAVKRAAAGALWFQLTPKFAAGTNDGDERAAEASERLGDVGAVLADVAEEILPNPDERNVVIKMARTLLGAALANGPEADADSPVAFAEPSGSVDAA